MKTSLLSLFAGTVFLTGAAVASAGEPVTLAPAELDGITAGQTNSYNVTATGFIAQSNSADVDVSQTATATAYGDHSWNYASASNYSKVDIDQSNWNSGNVTVSASQYN
jgi:hypothetical protein